MTFDALASNSGLAPLHKEKTIKILFFASLQQAVGLAEIEWPCHENQSCADLYQALVQQFNLPPVKASLRVAINHQFAKWTDHPKNGDIIAFIPPVSGG